MNLPETRTREHLLTVDFDQRETFAYACEVYSRILTLSSTPKERLSLCDEALDEFVPPCENVDMEKFRLALMEAVRARNGWKKILAVCAMRSVKRTHL